MKHRLYRISIRTGCNVREESTTSDRDVLKAIEAFNNNPDDRSIVIEYMDTSFMRKQLLCIAKGE